MNGQHVHDAYQFAIQIYKQYQQHQDRHGQYSIAPFRRGVGQPQQRDAGRRRRWWASGGIWLAEARSPYTVDGGVRHISFNPNSFFCLHMIKTPMFSTRRHTSERNPALLVGNQLLASVRLAQSDGPRADEDSARISKAMLPASQNTMAERAAGKIHRNHQVYSRVSTITPTTTAMPRPIRLAADAAASASDCMRWLPWVVIAVALMAVCGCCLHGRTSSAPLKGGAELSSLSSLSDLPSSFKMA